jgi:hypothetical protein
LKLNKQEALLSKKEKVQKVNQLDTQSFHCSQGSVIKARQAVEEMQKSKNDVIL